MNRDNLLLAMYMYNKLHANAMEHVHALTNNIIDRIIKKTTIFDYESFKVSDCFVRQYPRLLCCYMSCLISISICTL